MLSPLEISCLLYYYTKYGDHVAGSNKVGIERLVNLRLIKTNDNHLNYSITGKGMAHVSQLMNCKLPESVWLLPSTEETILKDEEL